MGLINSKHIWRTNLDFFKPPIVGDFFVYYELVYFKLQWKKKYIAIYNTFCIARRVVKKIIKVSNFFKTAYR